MEKIEALNGQVAILNTGVKKVWLGSLKATLAGLVGSEAGNKYSIVCEPTDKVPYVGLAVEVEHKSIKVTLMYKVNTELFDIDMPDRMRAYRLDSYDKTCQYMIDSRDNFKPMLNFIVANTFRGTAIENLVQ